MEQGKRRRGVKGVLGEKRVHEENVERAHEENPQVPQDRGEALRGSVTSVAGKSALVLGAFVFQEAAAGLRALRQAMDGKD